MTAVLFANPSAQSGRARKLVDKASELLSRAGIAHTVRHTAPHGETVDLVRRAIDEEGADLVVYLGGDGTFAEVAKGVLASSRSGEVRIGMLPTGTANDQGKSLGLAAGADALPHNVRVIAAGHETRLDVGKVERLDETGTPTYTDWFFDSFSVGFSADVLHTRNIHRDAIARVPLLRAIYRDQLVYAGALVRRLLDTYIADAKFAVDASLDGSEVQFDSLLDIIVKNTTIYGGEWVLDPTAEHDDGAFEIVPVEGRRHFTSKLLATYRRSPIDERALREIGIEGARPRRAARVDLRVRPATGRPLPAAQIDGEEMPSGARYRVECLARRLRVIAPAAAPTSR